IFPYFDWIPPPFDTQKLSSDCTSARYSLDRSNTYLHAAYFCEPIPGKLPLFLPCPHQDRRAASSIDETISENQDRRDRTTYPFVWVIVPADPLGQWANFEQRYTHLSCQQGQLDPRSEIYLHSDHKTAPDRNRVPSPNRTR